MHRRDKLVVLDDDSCNSFEYRFDQGNFASISFSGVESPIVISPFLDVNGRSQWFAFRKPMYYTPTFVFDKTKIWFTLTSGMWAGTWATKPDTDEWNRFDNFEIGATNVTFSNDEPFTGMTYVSLFPMYPFSRTKRLVEEWSENSLVGETPSTTNKIIGFSENQKDSGNRYTGSLPYYGFKISNGSAGTKNKIILTARQHAAEPQGGFAFEGAVDWLLTPGIEQNFLLNYFDFYCYPCLYPENVFTGHSRAVFDDYTKDYNSKWSTTGDVQAVDTFKQTMSADTDGTIEAGLDFHGYGSASAAILDVQDDTDLMIQEYYTQFNTISSVSIIEENIPNGLVYWWLNTLNARLALYAEHGLLNTKTPADWKQYGVNSMRTLVKMLIRAKFTNSPSIASMDFNGTTNRIDWASVYNPAGQPRTVSLWLKLDTNRANQYFFNIGDGDTYGCWIATASSAGMIQFSAFATGWTARCTAATVATTGAWFNLVGTFTGVVGDYKNFHIYKNGVEVTYYDTGSVNGSGTETNHTGHWSIGGRRADDLRNTDGKIAQVAVWDRVLTSGEISQLAGGYAPSLIPSGLRFYYPGNVDSYVATPGGTGTPDGTTFTSGDGPLLIYP